MIQLKRRINLFILPQKNAWWVLKITGKHPVIPKQETISHSPGTGNCSGVYKK